MTSLLAMYAVTPCHAGSGSSTSAIDLPIQRERHTNWPVIHASGLKGAMRAQFDRSKGKEDKELTELVFGSEKAEFAGSLTVSDVRILAFPMRSSFAPFVWVTCPAVLSRLNKDLKFAGKTGDDLAEANRVGKSEAYWMNGAFQENKDILLEDVEVKTLKNLDLKNMAALFAKAERLLLVHDEIFNYAVSNCTSIMAQIKIDQKTGTTETGSLRYQEELPSDTLTYAVVNWGDSRDPGEKLKLEAIKGFVTQDAITGHIQIGGDETLGRGIFEIEWI